MECPEVSSFSEPEPLITIEEFDRFPEAKLKHFPFGHLITVIVPDTPKLDHAIADTFCNDSQYYKAVGFKPSMLLESPFLIGFVRNGHLAMLSVKRRIDCDNCLAVTPNGKLFLRLKKDTYEQLNLQGHVSRYTKKIGDPYIVSIDLNEPTLNPDRLSTQKLGEVLDKIGKFEVILSWQPHHKTICPSSVAKYLDNRKCIVKLCKPNFRPKVVFTKMMPLFKSDYTCITKHDKDKVAEFVEWLGAVSLDVDMDGSPESYINTYEPPMICVLSGATQILRFKGFFQPLDIQKLVNHFKEYILSNKTAWISIYVQGFADSPVGWYSEEHQYFLNGDNGYITIFNKEDKSMLVSFGCSKKMLK